jgi:Recombination endonuclease VII
MARQWTCRGCRTVNPRVKQKCQCGRKRPAPRTVAHKLVLNDEYQVWVDLFGEVCGICGVGPKSRKLDRDHCHTSGGKRGLLCHRCNRALPGWIDAVWLRAAADYLDRFAERSAT